MAGPVQAHQEAIVTVNISTLWTSPGAVRPCDAPATAATPDVAGWVSGMDAEDRLDLHDRTLTQPLLGDRVRVEDITDGWAKVIVRDQPCARLDPRGYPGWLPVPHLTSRGTDDEANTTPYVVDATSTDLRATPDGQAVLPGVALGTRLAAVGAAREGHLPVLVPGGADALWVRSSDVVPAPTRPPTGPELVEVAQRLTGVPYVWGGTSPHGIDCSGLVYLSHRRFGCIVPRDASDQADASRPLVFGQDQPGDLNFFARNDAPIYHVGFVTEGRLMLHASQSAGHVLLQPVEGDLATTLVAVHRSRG